MSLKNTTRWRCCRVVVSEVDDANEAQYTLTLQTKEWTQQYSLSRFAKQGWRENTRHSDVVVRRKVGLLVLCS